MKRTKRNIKYVRIDAKTQIEVSVNIPDDIARENYLARISKPLRAPYTHAMTNTPNNPVRNEFKEYPTNE